MIYNLIDQVFGKLLNLGGFLSQSLFYFINFYVGVSSYIYQLLYLKGEYQLVYISPENLINNPRYRKMLLRQVYKENLVALVIDEAHCVQTWGESFRIAFAEIGNLRSIIPSEVNIMALTATVTQKTFKTILERLALISVSPQRDNIFFKVSPPVDLDELTAFIKEELEEKRIAFPKTDFLS